MTRVRVTFFGVLTQSRSERIEVFRWRWVAVAYAFLVNNAPAVLGVFPDAEVLP